MTTHSSSLPVCRICATPLTETFVDLGMSPPCENFLTADALDTVEAFYPLHVRICTSCLLVQLPEYLGPDEIFAEYAYFSSACDASSTPPPAASTARAAARSW